MRCSTWPPPQGVPPYLHVCYLVLFPVEALHLVLLQLLSGLHVLVVVTLATHMQNKTYGVAQKHRTTGNTSKGHECGA